MDKISSLEIKNIDKIFNKGEMNEKKVIKNLSLVIEKGEFVNLLGSNGSGKSTLFNIISGKYQIDNGEIYLNSDNIKKISESKRAKKISRVRQNVDNGIVLSMTIIENLVLALCRGEKINLKFALNKSRKQKILEFINEFDVSFKDMLDLKAGVLSGGQKQELALMMATINEPEILLLDEHTAALDLKSKKKIIKITKKIINQKNITTLMITHDIDIAFDCGNRLIVLQNGKIVADSKNHKKDLELYNEVKVLLEGRVSEVCNKN